MSWDKTTKEWHLTPHGWVEGTFSVYGNVQNPGVISPPGDRVETWLREMEQSSGFSREVVTWNRNWKSTDYTEEEIQALYKKYPKPN